MLRTNSHPSPTDSLGGGGKFKLVCLGLLGRTVVEGSFQQYNMPITITGMELFDATCKSDHLELSDECQ